MLGEWGLHGMEGQNGCSQGPTNQRMGTWPKLSDRSVESA